MERKIIIVSTIVLSSFAFSQVGINIDAPQSTFDVTAKNSTGTSTNVDGLLIPRLDRQRAQNMTGVQISTLIYVNSIATGTQTGTAINIDGIGYYYFNGTIWIKLNANENSNASVQSFQLRIPPHGQTVADFTNHTNTAYDSDNWWVISKSSVNPGSGVPARMTLVYEYQGSAFPDLNKIFPQLTAGNNTSNPDIFSPAFINLSTVGGKTRLTVSVSRTDNIVTQWGGTFLLNVLFAIKS